jgi:hypothetical protein
MAGLVVRRGLTVRQTEMVVAELLDLGDDATRAQQIAHRLEGPVPGTKPGVRATRLCRSETDWLAGDIRTVRQGAARLEARLSGGTLAAIGMDAAVLAGESLLALVPVLVALQHTICRVCDAKTSSPEKDAA